MLTSTPNSWAEWFGGKATGIDDTLTPAKSFTGFFKGIIQGSKFLFHRIDVTVQHTDATPNKPSNDPKNATEYAINRKDSNVNELRLKYVTKLLRVCIHLSPQRSLVIFSFLTHLAGHAGDGDPGSSGQASECG